MAADILVIEDNYANLELLMFLLRAHGHRPTGASDGEAALCRALTEKPDLILCDLQLPVIDGYELARRIKSEPDLRSVPLIAVTAFAMPGDRDKAIAAGCDGYIAKPIVPETFVAQLEPFLPAAKRGEQKRPDLQASRGPKVSETSRRRGSDAERGSESRGPAKARAGTRATHAAGCGTALRAVAVPSGRRPDPPGRGETRSAESLHSGMASSPSMPLLASASRRLGGEFRVESRPQTAEGVPNRDSTAIGGPHSPPGNAILIVEHSEMDRELVHRTLAPAGYRLSEAVNLTEAVHLALERQFALIISGLHMPGGDGYELLRIVKANPALGDVPVLMIATNAPGADRTTALALGAAGFLPRPFSPADLLAEVTRCMSQFMETSSHAEHPGC